MPTLSIVSSILIPLAAFGAGEPAAESSWRVYIGTYTSGSSEGIYVADFDATTGQLGTPALAAKTENPSFLALHPTLPVLYAVGEAGTGGTVSAFRIDAATGGLTLLNQQSSVGSGPCHVAVAPNGKHVAAANYGGGSTVLLPVKEDGSLGEASAFVQHEGSSVDPKRQEAPHAHAVYFERGQLFVADLGLDKVRIYDYNADKGTLSPHSPASISVTPGGGPRHVAFHSSGKFVYVLNEMGNTVEVFSRDADASSFTPLQTIGTLPGDFTGNNSTAEIFIHPSGKFLYASNRGHDSIAAFGISEADGTLRVLGHALTGGKTPRSFAIDSTGRFLLAANQNSDSVVVLKIDQDSGVLSAGGGMSVVAPAPVCLVFVGK